MAKKTQEEVNKINEETLKRFKQLNEYSFITKKGDLLLDEDDEQPTDGVSMEEPEVEVETPEVNGLEQSTPIEQIPETTPEETSNGEVEIDVTDLTQKQETMSNSIENIASQTNNLITLLGQIETKLDQSNYTINAELENLKKEIEVRNPTPKEVLQKSVTIGNPLNQTPEQYWAEKQAEGKYELSDSDGVKEKEYSLKASDIDNNKFNVYKSFGLNDDEVNQSLKGVLGF